MKHDSTDKLGIAFYIFLGLLAAIVIIYGFNCYQDGCGSVVHLHNPLNK